MKWINENFCSFDELVRIELGPQVIILDCTEENLSNRITSAHYFTGQKDALGYIIDPSKKGKMHCVDWRQRFVPNVWKIYKFNKDLNRFDLVEENENKDEAIKSAQVLLGEI
jgi:hypothetical protein